MNNENDAVFVLYCPGCRETSSLPKASVGDSVACPSCGLSINIDGPEKPKGPEDQTFLERAYADQQEASRIFQQTQGLLRVEFRVFRLAMFANWETLFEEVRDFANELAPDALISISHSAGSEYGSNAATVWYWRKEPIHEENKLPD
jgi:hypothetical protein